MKVLLVGASGFMGRNLLIKLPKQWDIYGVYNTSQTFTGFLEEKQLDNVIPIKCDLTEEQVKKEIAPLGDVDVCVYLAANTNVREMVENPIVDMNTNIAPLVNFLNICRGKKIIFLSSGAVYMGHSGGISPELKIDPTIPYSISKYTCEQYLKFFCTSRKMFDDYVILRFFGAYGPFEPKRKISTKLIETIRDKKDVFTIFGDGRNYIDFMYIDDATRGIMSVVNGDKANLTVDFCSGSPLTLNELVQRVSEIFDMPIKIKHEGVSPEYITYYASPSNMYRLFNFKPQISLDEGFNRFHTHLINELD